MFNIQKRSATKQTGLKAIIYGVDKIGKTSLLLTAPKPLFVALEKGIVLDSTMPDVDEINDISSYADLMSLLDDVIAYSKAGKFEYQSLVFDSATIIEKLIINSILEKEKPGSTIDTAMGGYGKGVTYATRLAADFIEKCDVIADTYGINVAFTAHSLQYKVIDEDTALEITKTEIMLHSPKNGKTGGIRDVFTQWAGLIGLLRSTYNYTDAGKSIEQDARELVLSPSPNIQSGNRYRVTQNIVIPYAESGETYQGWNYIAQAIYDSKGLDFFAR